MHLVLAYIDPGSGSLLVQALIATIVATPFVLRQQIARFVRRLRGHTEPVADSAPSDPDPAG